MKLLAMLILSLLSSAVMAVAPMANVEVVRVPVLTAHLVPARLIENVAVKQVTFLPLQKTFAHTHPFPMLGYITKGEVYFQLSGQQPQTLTVGQSFYEPANVLIMHFDNLTKEPVTFMAYYLLEKDQADSIKMPSFGNKVLILH